MSKSKGKALACSPGKRMMENTKKDVKQAVTEEEKIRALIEAVNLCPPSIARNDEPVAKAIEMVTNFALRSYHGSMMLNYTDSDGDLDVAMAMYKIARNNFEPHGLWIREPLYVKIEKVISIYVGETGIELWNEAVTALENNIKNCAYSGEGMAAERQQLLDDLLKIGPHGFAMLYQPFNHEPDTMDIKRRLIKLR